MNSIVKWVIDNKEWVFSGVGVAIAGFIIGLILKKRVSGGENIKMTQKSGRNSFNYQSAGTMNINVPQKKENENHK